MTETGAMARPRTRHLDLFRCLDRHDSVKDPTLRPKPKPCRGLDLEHR